MAVSFESPEYTADVDAIGTQRLLEAIRPLGLEMKTRFYEVSTSELYGLVQEIPQKETTPFYPRSPYAAAKMYAYRITVNPTVCMHATVFCLITSHYVVVKYSSHAKLPAALRILPWALSLFCAWGVWMR